MRGPLGYDLHWYYGAGYAHASQNAWRSYEDIAADAKAPATQVAPDDHGTKTVFARALKVAAGDLDYCNAKR
jgi:hypothetical protein